MSDCSQLHDNHQDIFLHSFHIRGLPVPSCRNCIRFEGVYTMCLSFFLQSCIHHECEDSLGQNTPTNRLRCGRKSVLVMVQGTDRYVRFYIMLSRVQQLHLVFLHHKGQPVGYFLYVFGYNSLVRT